MAEPWAVVLRRVTALDRTSHKEADMGSAVVAVAAFPEAPHPAHDFGCNFRRIAEYNDYT